MQVVLCGFFGKYLRCKPGNFDEAVGNGCTGGLARWNFSFGVSYHPYYIFHIYYSCMNIIHK